VAPLPEILRRLRALRPRGGRDWALGAIAAGLAMLAAAALKCAGIPL
jgi:hypothetical protein